MSTATAKKAAKGAKGTNQGDAVAGPPEGHKLEIEWIEACKVHASPYQRRTKFDQGKLDELAESIREQGILSPLIVRMVESELKNPRGEPLLPMVELVAGERRLRAAKLVGMDKVPAIVRDLTDREAAKICVMENLQREDLTLVEEGESFRALKDLGMTVEEIAAEVGVGWKYVGARLRILDLPGDALEAVGKGWLTLHAADKLVKVPEEKREAALKELGKAGLDDGTLNQRGAEALLERRYLEPVRIARKYAKVRDEVESLLPECEWVEWEEANRLDFWDSGFASITDAPGWPELKNKPDDGVPTWGELAAKYEKRAKVAAKYEKRAKVAARYDEELKDSDPDNPPCVEGFIIGEFEVIPVVRMQPLIDADLAACEAKGITSIFAAPKRGEKAGAGTTANPVETDEERREREEREAEAKRKAEAREVERRALLMEMVTGGLSQKKERDLVVRFVEEGPFWEILDFAIDSLFAHEMSEWDEAEREKFQKRFLAMARKPEGGMAFLGRLMVVGSMGSVHEGFPWPVVKDMGLLAKCPELADLAEEEMAKQVERERKVKEAQEAHAKAVAGEGGGE